MNNSTNSKSPGYVYVQIKNVSGYIARFKISYILRGKLVREQSRNLSLGQSDKIYIPEEAISIILDVEESLIFGWRPFFIKKFKGPATECYELSGTAFNPQCKEVPCTNL